MAWSPRLPAFVTTTLLFSVVGMLPTVASHAASAAVSPPCVTVQDTEQAALAMARRCGYRVEARDSRSETTQVFANPGGHMTAEQSLRPRWARTGDGSWVDADATLRRTADGSIAPVAPVFPMTFSGGGKTALASLRKAGHAMSLSWPGTLPEPVLAGATATYPEVFPGVDLQIQVEVDGFTHLLVVKNREAAANPALRKIRFGLTGTDLTFGGGGGGVLSAKNKAGEPVFTSGTATMWDSRGVQKTGAAAGQVGDTKARTAVVRTKPGNGTLDLELDQAMLASADTVFPVYIDPSWTGQISGNAFTMVWSRSDTVDSSFWQRTNALNNSDTKGDMGAGRTCDVPDSNGGCDSVQYLIRSLIRMDVSAVAGKHILGAKFSIEQRWAWTCFTGNNTKLWLTGAISSATTWNAQPSWDSAYTAETVGNKKLGAVNGCAGPGSIEFAVTHLVNRALALGSPTLTVGLRPTNESDVNYWKRFNHATAALAIDYNSIPTVGTQSTSFSTSCVASTGTTPLTDSPLSSDDTPDLYAVAADADTETDLKGVFELQRWMLAGEAGAGQPAQWGTSTSKTDAIARANGGTTTVNVTVTSGTYRWRAKISDPWSYAPSSGTDYSADSPWCEFRVDVTPPSVPTVTSTQYSDNCHPCGGIGTTGRFTISIGDPADTDVNGYYWGFTQPPTNLIPVTAGASATFDWTPVAGGPQTLYVQARDNSGHTSGIRTDYDFTVDGADPLQARWRFTEQLDDFGVAPPLADSSGNNRDATLVGGTLGVPARVPGQTALGLDGTAAQYATLNRFLDTSRSFSVSAWVKLNTKGAVDQTVVSQQGAYWSSFYLQYDAGIDRWVFELPSSQDQTPAPTWWVAESLSAPQAGIWTHLTGVYDSAAKKASLYVDGVFQTAETNVVTWDATGEMRLGRSGSAYLNGSLADVKAWQRVLFDSEIRDMSQPSAETKTGEYHFNETYLSYALDSSNLANNLFLSGGAEIPASGAGYDGTGLLLMDGTGDAIASSPAVYTSQSYTVSAWVRLDGTALPTIDRTVVGQSGNKVSAFFLGYKWESATSTGRWRIYLPGSDADGGNSGGVSAKSTPFGTEVLGKWTHLQATVDGATREVKLYVNGVLDGQAVKPTPLWDAYGPLTVGGALWTELTGGEPTLANHRWLGAIDEVRVYAGVLPAQAADWRFGQCTGSPVVCADGASPAHPLTLSGDATWSASGYGQGSGLTLNGTGSAATAGPVLDTTKSFTVSAWVKLTDTTTNACAVCFDGTRTGPFILGYHKGVNKWRFWAHSDDTDTAVTTGAESLLAPQLNTWTHLTGVYDAINGEIKLYVNGELASTTKYTKGWQATGPVVIGREKWAAGATNFWKGSLDEVRIYQGVIADPTFLLN